MVGFNPYVLLVAGRRAGVVNPELDPVEPSLTALERLQQRTSAVVAAVVGVENEALRLTKTLAICVSELKLGVVNLSNEDYIKVIIAKLELSLRLLNNYVQEYVSLRMA